MTNSRSKASRSRPGAAVVLVGAMFAATLAVVGAAHADKKRVVVLELSGPKGDRFHDELVKLLKKSHTVISTDKWNGTAEALDAASTSTSDLKKVASKLKIDAIVEGKIEKRGDAFILRLKLHDGRGDRVGGPISTKAVGSRIAGKAQRELTEELVDAIDKLEVTGGDDDRPAAVPGGRASEPVANRPARPDDEGEHAPASKQVASRTEAREAVEADAPVPASVEREIDDAVALSPGHRALDVMAGVSLTSRQLAFQTRADLATKPPGYDGGAVAGAMVDATLYPLALGDKRSGLASDLGINVMYDRVLKISSRNRAGDVFATTQSRFGIGAVLRHAFGSSATAPVLIGSLGYSNQAFTIDNAAAADFSSVQYAIIEPGLGLRYPVTRSFTIGVDARLMIVAGAGDIQTAAQYGTGSALGGEGALAIDYLLTRSVFARAAFRYETISLAFNGDGMQSNARDGNPMTVDVQGARDSYIGGFATVGFVY